MELTLDQALQKGIEAHKLGKDDLHAFKIYRNKIELQK